MESNNLNLSFKPTDIVIDKENMCVDRNCDAGKAFDALQRQADLKAGTDEGTFMNHILAYAEASFVIMGTLPPNEAKKAMDQLAVKFNSTCEAQKRAQRNAKFKAENAAKDN